MALSLAPGLFKAHYNLALALSKQKKTEEAVKEYYESMRLAPGSVDADTLVNLANELGRQGNFDRAIEVYKKALAIQPDNINAHRNLGLAYALAGKTDEAIAEFRLVLKARPNDVETWCNLGISCSSRARLPMPSTASVGPCRSTPQTPGHRTSLTRFNRRKSELVSAMPVA